MSSIWELNRCVLVRALIACLLALDLTACHTLSNTAQNVYAGYAADPIDLSTQTKAGPLLDSLKARVADIESCFATQYRSGSGKAEFCAGQRNQAISLLMTESAYLCVQHLTQIYGKEAAVNIATGSIASLSSALAAISPLSRAQALSALSSFSSAERALMNETIYKNLMTTAIATKIEEMRSTGGRALLAKKTQKYDDYRVEDAVSDVLDYHASCAFHRGLELALKEGTNTNPESKRRAAEVKAQALQNQIDTRATILNLDSAAKQKLLDPKVGTANIGDPVLKSLVDQYQAQAQEILSASQPAPAAKKAASDPGVPSLDLAIEETPDPLAALNGAFGTVARAPATAVAQLAKDGKRDDQEVPKVYLDQLKKEVEIGAAFRASLQAILIPEPDKDGSITKALNAYDAVYRKFLAIKSTLDLTKLADKKKEIDLVAEVSKEALNLKLLVDKIQACENEALKRVNDSRDGELTKVKALSLDKFLALPAGLLDTGKKPKWSADDAKVCLK